MTEQDNSIVMLPKVRCSFLHIEKPHAPPNSSEAKYSADFLLDQANPQHVEAWNALYATVWNLAQEKWKDVAAAVLTQVNQDPKLRGYGDGNTRVNKKTMQVLDGYAGCMYVSAKNANAPDIIGGDGKAIDLNNALVKAKKPYAGCFVNALVRIWLQDNQFGRGVRFDLLAVQFAEDGPAFGAAQVETEGYFEAIPGAPAPLAQPGQAAPAVTPAAAPTAAPMAQPGSQINPPW